jgi:hypothetical protein
LAVKPTNNPEAYDAYLRGLAFQERFSSSFNSAISEERPSVFMSARCSLTPILRLPGRGFRARTLCFTFIRSDTAEPLKPRAAMRRNVLWKMRTNWIRPRPETLLALGYYQFWVLQDYELAKTRSVG